jgi:hypothetical protein
MNFNSLIITNMELRFEPCVQLDFEVRCKRPKKRDDHVIFINFGVKKSIIDNTQKKKTLMFGCYNLLAPIE